MFPAGLKLVKHEASFPDTKTREILALQRAKTSASAWYFVTDILHMHMSTDRARRVKNTAGRACFHTVVERGPRSEPDASLQ